VLQMTSHGTSRRDMCKTKALLKAWLGGINFGICSIQAHIHIGIFQSQDDIARSPTQTPPGAICEAKFAVINNDAIIEQTDKVIADVIMPAENGTITKTVIIYQ